MRVQGANPDGASIEWASIFDTNRSLWADATRRTEHGPNVLVATSVGGLSALSMIESVLAVALTLRGARVSLLLCDKVLPACLRTEKLNGPTPADIGAYKLARMLCDGCVQTGAHYFASLQLPIVSFSSQLTDDERERARDIAERTPVGEVPEWTLDGARIGEHAYAGALRYFASGNLAQEPDGDVIVRRYFEGALLTHFVMRRLLQSRQFTSACFNHGIYSPQGVVGENCRRAGVRVVNWNVAYRKRCFIFSHEDTYHHTLLDEPTSTWESMPWTSAMEADIRTYLQSRWQGTRDWVWFHEKPDEEFEAFGRGIGIDFSKPIVGLLTNVMWDAQLHYRANAFPNMLAWVVRTVRYFEQRPDLQLLIRVHPAEVRGTLPSRQPLVQELARVYPRLPKNVFVIPPESPVSTYAAMTHCDSAIIYGTKTGVELTSLGIPVLVAGEAWIRNKGVTLDASTENEYLALLDRLPLRARMDPDQVTRARRYAYHFFFRRMIPFAFMEPTQGWPPYRVAISCLDDLMPGRDPGLDLVCEGIMTGSPFVYEAERLGIHDR